MERLDDDMRNEPDRRKDSIAHPKQIPQYAAMTIRFMRRLRSFPVDGRGGGLRRRHADWVMAVSAGLTGTVGSAVRGGGVFCGVDGRHDRVFIMIVSAAIESFDWQLKLI